MSRPDRDPYYLGVAESVSARGDCSRRQVGCVIVNFQMGEKLVATGYNGSYPGGPSCLAGECPRGRLSNEELPPGTSYDTGPGACHAIHDAPNALMRAAWVELQGATFYSNHEPCDGCLRLLQGSGIDRIVWALDSEWHTGCSGFNEWHKVVGGVHL